MSDALERQIAAQIRENAGLAASFAENTFIRDLFTEMIKVGTQLALTGETAEIREVNRNKVNWLHEFWGNVILAQNSLQDAEAAERSARAHE